MTMFCTHWYESYCYSATIYNNSMVHALGVATWPGRRQVQPKPSRTSHDVRVNREACARGAVKREGRGGDEGGNGRGQPGGERG